MGKRVGKGIQVRMCADWEDDRAALDECLQIPQPNAYFSLKSGKLQLYRLEQNEWRLVSTLSRGMSEREYTCDDESRR